MPSKTEEYLALAQRTANGLTRYWESWTDYLTTASRLYKYPFAAQLMIYAQRPDATACADFDIWNNRMNRYVRRGAKGIALLDESGGFPRLHYVFDVSDTAPRRNALYPDLWQINESLKEPVRSMLAENYGVHSESFGQQLADVAGKLVQSYWDNNSSDILGIVDGSYFLPNLTLNQPRKQLNRYGRLRRTYLMNHRPVVYSTMLLNGTLYRKSGYSKAFLEAHREEITLHKAVKAAIDEAGLQKLPKVKELDEEFAELLTKKKAAYPDYRKARDEMQQLMKAQKNVEFFFAEDKSNLRPQHTR